ncbi:MAG: citrulline utilization hydrolase CtlX [Flavobacteriaceae bacterium]
MKRRQQSDTVFMVRPTHFTYNVETAVSNAFQQKTDLSDSEIQEKVTQEFDAFVRSLEENGITVEVMESSKHPIKPDAVFPNNWISLHQDGTLCLYPMLTKNRQKEREEHIITALKHRFDVKKVIDFTPEEAKGRIVEGTGSIIFDHPNKIAYACLSERTENSLFKEICEKLDYRPLAFTALDANKHPIYHTNVMMAIGEAYAIVCLESIVNLREREMLINSFASTGHRLISISLAQMNAFAGNALELINPAGKRFLALSKTAFNALTKAQKEIITETAQLLPLDVTTIERIGGGSVRCMLAEIFTPRINEYNKS